jgi:hypothetical protein
VEPEATAGGLRILPLRIGNWFTRKRGKQPEGLISVLLEVQAEFGDRHDAAMDLGGYDEPSAEEALLHVALKHEEDDGIADAAGESLLEIWKRKGKHDAALVARMHPAAQKFFQQS